VEEVALKQGMISIPDNSGTNIDVQILIRQKLIGLTALSISEFWDKKPVLIVMDYAFGEQAYETIDELLKPFKRILY
jgi:hypothetical protein